MRNIQEPRVLTDKELIDFEQSERCQRSWYARSLLLTLAAIRAEAEDNELASKLKLSEAQQRVKWYERTYSQRPEIPLIGRKSKGKPCPHCKKHGAANIGDNWCCLECGKTWSEKT